MAQMTSTQHIHKVEKISINKEEESSRNGNDVTDIKIEGEDGAEIEIHTFSGENGTEVEIK